ncbi:MAG: hypothetical protein AAB215_05965 [Planctomycetota bacterium]
MSVEHPPFEAWASLVEGILPLPESAALKAHAAACPECASELARARRGVEIVLKRGAASSVPPPLPVLPERGGIFRRLAASLSGAAALWLVSGSLLFAAGGAYLLLSPPAAARPVPFEAVSAGVTFKDKIPAGNHVIRDRAAARDFILVAPPVDFDRSTLLVLATPAVDNVVPSIEVKRIQDDVKRLIVEFTTYKGKPRTSIDVSGRNAYQAIFIPRTNLPVEFREVGEIDSCAPGDENEKFE